MSDSVTLARLKQIVRGVAEFGIEEAGTRVLGSGWPSEKKVLAPIFEELQKRFPALFLMPGSEAAKAAEHAISALTLDKALEKQSIDILEHLDEQHAKIGLTHDTILKSVVGVSETLQGVTAAIDRISEEQRTGQAGIQELVREFRKLQLTLDPVSAEPDLDLSIEEVYARAAQFQYDAMRWLNAGDPAVARLRVLEGKKMTPAASQHEPNNPDLLGALGFFEKIEAQVAWETGEGDASTHVGTAAKDFAKAVELDSENVNSLNRLVNIYLFARD